MGKEKIKILFVCMGNICRSPTAQGVFSLHTKQHKVSHLFEIDSAGTHAYHIGEQPDTRSQLAVKAHNIDLSQQRARQVDKSDFYYYDKIFAMDTANLSDLQAICPLEYQHKISLLLDNIPHSKTKDVPDPYFDDNFDQVFVLVNQACDLILQNLLMTKLNNA